MKQTSIGVRTKQILKLNIKSWCQKVLDLPDLTFADFVELHGTLFSVNYQIYLGLSKYLDGDSDKCHFFFQTRKEK